MLQESDLKTFGGIKIKRLKPRTWLLVGVASVLMLAAGLGVWAVLNAGKTGADKGMLAVVKRGSVPIRISATGTIRPYNQVKLSPKYTGLLRKLLVRQGEFVKAGQLVALMDDSNLVGQVQAAEAAYQAAAANYEKAVHGSRPQEVADAEAQLRKSQSAVRFATMAVSRAKAEVASTEAQVKRDETNAQRLTMLASQGAISDQDRLNATTQASMSQALNQKAQQELKQAEASLSQAMADVQGAEQRYSMAKEGYRREDVKAAHQQMIQAEGNLKFLRSQMNDTRIRAPFDGIVTQKYTDEGAIVAPTTASATNSATSSSIISLAGNLELVAAVSETDIDHIKPGQPVEIVANAYPTKTFHGHVTLIAPEAILNQNVTTFEVHASIDDDANHQLMSGMNVNADFIAGKQDDVLLVPTVAITAKKAKTGVFVPDSAGNPTFRPVKLGTTTDTSTIVLEGLKDGEKVFLGLSKEQLAEQGYNDKNISNTGGKPEIPRGLRNKL